MPKPPARKAPPASAKIPAKGASTAKTAKIKKNLPEVHTIESVVDFTQVLTELEFSTKNLWYRGIGNPKHSLIPSLLRHSRAKSKQDFSKLELDLNETFRMRSFPYTEAFKWLDKEWDHLFFMQHHRVPTRLLDWSGSPLVSLHFALTSAEMIDGSPQSDAVVWILDPLRWNECIFSGTDFKSSILSPKDARLNPYLPSEVYGATTNIPPVAMRGAHNSSRVVAQQGYFTIFGPERKSMEDFFSTHKLGDGKLAIDRNCLTKIKIPKGKISKIKKEMFSLGISESSIYPDLEGLSFELKRIFEF